MTFNKPVLCLSLVGCLAAFAQPAQVPWSARTPVILSTNIGDTAIFVNPADRGGETRVFGTDTVNGGLYVLTLDGGTLGSLNPSTITGVDSRRDVRFAGGPKAVVVASSFAAGTFVYGLSDAGTFTNVLSRALNVAGSGATALSTSPDGGLEVWLDNGSVTLKRVGLFEAAADSQKLDWVERTDSVTFAKPVSGIVIDSRTRRMFASVSTDGIYSWAIDGLTPPTLAAALDGGTLGGPPTGLALYPLAFNQAVLLVALPSSDEFAAYRVSGETLTYLTRFRVGVGATVARSGSAIDATNAPLPGFPSGMLVVSDRSPSLGSAYALIRWDALSTATDGAIPDETPKGLGGDGGSDGGQGDGGTGTVVIFPNPGDGGPGVVRDGGIGECLSCKPEPTPCGCSVGFSPAVVPFGLLLFTLAFRRRKS